MGLERERRVTRSTGTAASATTRPRRNADAATVVGELARRGQTVAVAESCTGGLLGGEITSVPGSSKVFWGGVIAYDNVAKSRLLGVRPEALDAHGAVSEETARRMAEGIRALADTTWGVSITGLAGPDGGSPERPVGTVWISVAGPRTVATRFLFDGDRAAVRDQAVEAALDGLFKSLRAVNESGR